MKKIFLFLLLVLGMGAAVTAAACTDRRSGHNFELSEMIIQPTCTEPGTAEYVCPDCGQTEVRQISPLQHDWGEWKVKISATCESIGYEVRICNNDPFHKEFNWFDLIDHDWGEWEIALPATCHNSGYEVRICKYNSSHIDNRLIFPHHEWNEWTVDTYATCLEQGEESRTCKLDYSHKETRPIEALGHTSALQNWVTLQNSTCIISGTDVLLCDRCSDVIETRREIVQAHEYSNGICENCGRRDWRVAQIDDPDLYNSEYGFSMLKEEEKGGAMQALYLQIDRDARIYHNGNSDSAILGTYDYETLGLTMDEAVAVWKTYMDDHPLYYWLGRNMYYGEVAEVLVDISYSSHSVRQSINQTIYKKANEWREDTEENAYLAALSYHDKIIYEVDYLDSRKIYPEGTDWAHNIVGVFEGKGAVCEGYARSFQLLLNMTGIENVFVTGKSRNSPHAWNAVKLDDGKWYWFDLTYDDIPGWMWGVQYNYFAVSEEQNIAWSDDRGYFETPVFFATQHTPDCGTGVNFLVRLPEISQTPYKGVGEPLLRQTFNVGKFTYAVAGYHSVQLIKCTATGNVCIPETVEYDGVTYEVISIGAMDEEGFFEDSFGDVYYAPIETLYIPASIRFMWTNAVHNTYKGGIVGFKVSEDNGQFASLDGVLFTKDFYTLISYPGKSAMTEYKIPDGVETIAYHAFIDGGENLRSFTIGKDVSEAGNTNWGNGWLRSDNTGSHSFIGGEWGFTIYHLNALETLSVDTENEYYSVENDVLFDKNKIILYAALLCVEELVVPSSVEIINYYACYVGSIRKLIFEGNSIKEIRQGAFVNCFNFKEVIFNGTQEEWDAVDKEGLDKYCDYTLTCTKE